MNSLPQTESEWQARVAILEARLSDLKARLPAHSISPAMIAELDELDEELAHARWQLATLKDSRRA